MQWQPEHDAQLRKLYGDGLSAGQIAVELACGVTRNAVIGRVHRLGLTRGGRTVQVTMVPRAPKPPRLPREAKPPAPKPERDNGVSHEAGEAGETGDELRDLPADQSPHAVAFLERKAGQCCWPLNDVVPIDQHQVCGDHAGDRSYCGRHYRLSIQVRVRVMSEEERHRRGLSHQRRHRREQHRALGNL